MTSPPPETAPEAVVKTPVWANILAVLALCSIGGVVGAFTPAFVRWASTLRWAPFKGPLKAIDESSGAVVTIGLIVAGVVAGIWISYQIDRDMLKARVSRTEVSLRRGDSEQAFHAAAVKAAFFNGKELVLLGPHGDELFRGTSDLAPARYRHAFESQGYQWLDSDPHRDEFCRWLQGDPALTARADTLLAERALARSQKKLEHVAVLKRRLADISIVVRDEKDAQLWRPFKPTE